MSNHTLIQWCDGSVNPVMGCTAQCELRPTVAQARNAALKFFQSAFQGSDETEVARLLDDALFDCNPTEIYQLRDETIDEVAVGLGTRLAHPAKVRKAYKAALDEVFVCYAHQQTMMRAADAANPYKRTNPGFPTQFENPTKFPGRMAMAAMQSDLYGKSRPDKPWLDYLPRSYFISDMGDALSDEIDFEYLKTEIIDVVSSVRGRQHLWFWLTKMPRRMAEFARWLSETHQLAWPDHLVAMTTVTSKKTEVRARQLLEVPARFRGISAEPLWSDITLPVSGIDWVIVGGQSGPSARPFDVAWIESIKAQCQQSGAALFVKQLGAKPVSVEQPIHLKDEHGGDWNEWPAEFRIREMPNGFRDLRQHADPQTVNRPAHLDAVPEVEMPATVPCRVPRSRKKDWRLPLNTICVTRPGKFGNPFPVEKDKPDEAIRLYEVWIQAPEQKSLLAEAKTKLRGKNLACWCKPGQPCHAEILLRLVNAS